MIKITEVGDANISLCGKYSFDVTYITDVPKDFLNGFIYLLSKYWTGKHLNQGVVISATFEPGNFYLVLSRGSFEDNNYYEITDGYGRHENTKRVYLGELDYVEMAKELINDIESDLSGWAGFYCGIAGETKAKLEEKFEDNKNQILKRLTSLKELVRKAEEVKHKKV